MIRPNRSFRSHAGMSTSPPRLSTLQQERSRDTRRRLVREAQRLWQTQGFEETTVGEICDAAGVSKGTFYFYFPHKEDLLIELGFPSDDEVPLWGNGLDEGSTE